MVWDEPYLETCCRAALHRVVLAGAHGRPDGLADGLKDGGCLHRLAGMGLVALRPDGRFGTTAAGAARHHTEVLGRAADSRRR